MSFQDAVALCFQKFIDFNGRAKRPEFWWFFLFCLIGSIVLSWLNEFISVVFCLVTLLPTLAVTSRRLHDINKSGWLQVSWHIGMTTGLILCLVALLGGSYTLALIGLILLVISLGYMIFLMLKTGDIGDNRFGPAPAN